MLVSAFIAGCALVAQGAHAYVPSSFLAASIGPPTVKINSTTLIGTRPASGIKSANGVPVAAYLGIPYAPQPVRFAPSTHYTLPAGNFNATVEGPICYQEFPGPGGPFEKAVFTTGSPLESENCLSINIWTPQKAGSTPESGLPVMFWIYGGALIFGGAGQPEYDGSVLASNDVVIVTFNYRTNVFGFPGAAQIPVLEQNLGLLDQRLALAWVKSNIAAFGGNPAEITIFGESAGALSVESLVLEGPATNPPFRAAIQDCDPALVFTERPIGPLWAALSAALGCTQTNGAAQLACMRAIPAETIVQTEQTLDLPFGVVVDNVTFFGDPSARRASGLAAKVPMVIGNNQDDGKLFVVGTTNFTSFLESTFGLSGASLAFVESLYPIGATAKYPTAFEAAAAAFRDGVFQCKARIDSAINAVHNGPTYRYLYQAVFANEMPIPDAGAYHSAELPLLFGTLDPGSTSSEITLAAVIQYAATQFAKNPTSAVWPAMTGKAGDRILVVANNTGISLQPQSEYDGNCIAFWDSYLLNGRSLTEFASET